MLLVVASLLVLLGGATWVVGHLLSYSGIATIGAALVLIVGGAIVLTGLEVRTGATKTLSYETINNSTVATETSVQYQYQQTNIGDIFGVGILGSVGIGGLLMLLGATLLSQSLAGEM